MDHNDHTFVFLWFNIDGWLLLHKIISVLLSIGIIIHLIRHSKWLVDIIKNNRLFKNEYKNKSLILFFILFCISAILGFISWIFNNHLEVRNILIEIHDKITFFLIILFIIHFVKKIKWFVKTSRSLLTGSNN